MGKWHKRKKGKKDGNSNKDGHGLERPKRERPTTGYVELIRENKEFEKYYKAQNIVPEDDWDEFMTCLKEDLPTAFRITGSKAETKALSKVMQEKYFSKAEPEVLEQLKPFCCPWYPDQLAWQLNLTRKMLRRTEAFEKFHQFLIIENETGNISRQEAVSMIPPILLNIEASHKVLDLCAAPGSKTAQILEFMESASGSAEVSGMVVANDVDNRRCYMLTHQVKRLQSPALVITNHDAAFMPNIHHVRKDGSVGPIKFDRILCDVPCSGDGTFRKNFDVWTKWNAVNGANLHGLQARILRRGLELLEVGGRIVYSTCSLNPLENEAVVNRIMTDFPDAVKLIDAAPCLTGLKCSAGLEDWAVLTRSLEKISSTNIPPECLNYLTKHHFPPQTDDEKVTRQLKKCIRILPHHQNTGGFFVAVLEKTNPLPGEKIHKLSEEIVDPVPPQVSSTTQRMRPPPKKRRPMGYKEEPFYFLSRESEVFRKIVEFYGISAKTADAALFLARTDVEQPKNIYFTNESVKRFIAQNDTRIKIINTGVKVLIRCDNKGTDCRYRLAQEGSRILLPLISKRKVAVKKRDLIILLSNNDEMNPPKIDDMHTQTKPLIRQLACGSVAFIYSEDDEQTEDEKTDQHSVGLRIQLVGWKGHSTTRCYVGRKERIHFLRLLGEDVTFLEDAKFATEDKKKTEATEETEKKTEATEETENVDEIENDDDDDDIEILEQETNGQTA